MNRLSINPTSQKQYVLPKFQNDVENINNFLKNNNEKKVVVVQGLGFVGSVMSLVVANAFNLDYAVIGVDLPNENSYWKICSINEGIFPVLTSDEKVDIFFKNTQENKNLYATYDDYAYSVADVIIVDINLDVQKRYDENGKLQFNVELGTFKQSIYSIANICKEDVLILIETTVPPGTCLNVVAPILNEVFQKRGLNPRYKIGHSYERVMPGPNYIDSIRNFYRVYSGINEESAKAVEDFLTTIIYIDKYPLTRLQNTTATEMAKVLENSYRAMNISFIQEWTNFAENSNVDLNEVLYAIKMRPTHQNIMLPGLGVGGYCLTKDSLLASWAAKEFYKLEGLIMSENAVVTNDFMPLHSFNNIIKVCKDITNKKILILGVSYLGNVGDTRYSPVELLYKNLIEKTQNIFLHDPYISFWEEVGVNVSTDLDEITKETFDIIIFCTKHNEYLNNSSFSNWLENLQNKTIFDTNLVLSIDQIKFLEKNNLLKIIGNGIK
jgi:UDP-N-acetyl-D-glucosamine dehydrogenase